MNMILIGGMWLTVDVWDTTVAALAEKGHRGIAVSLLGQDDQNTAATLDDQLAAVLAAIDAAAADGEKPLVVGHSAACTLAWLAADRRPDTVSGTALVGGFPTPPGGVYFDAFPAVDGVVPFPGWEPFAGPDSADLSEAQKTAFAAAAVAVPQGVTAATVTYADDRRFDLPVTLVCPEFTPADAKDWIASGDVPEIAAATRVSYVDIDTGHWPMVTAPAVLAAALAEAAVS